VVQVGAFAASEAAEEIAADLLGKGYSVFVAEPTGGDGRWRVRVGPVADRAAADALAATLASAEGLPTWVRSASES
jgi:cell division septation protein DedD